MSAIHEAMRAFGLGARAFFLSDGFWIGWAYAVAVAVPLLLVLAVLGRRR